MKVIPWYEAFTGEAFPTEAACRAHEKEHVHKRLIGLSEAAILAALDGTDPDLGDAIELIGSRIGIARLARGERKRERRNATLAIEGPREGDAPPQDDMAA